MVQESPRLRTSPAPGLPCYCTTGRRGPPIGTIFPSMTKKKGWCSAGSKKRRCRCSGGIGWTLAAPLGHVIPKLGGVAVRSALSPAWTGFRRFKVRVADACAPATLCHTNLMRARRRHGRARPEPQTCSHHPSTPMAPRAGDRGAQPPPGNVDTAHGTQLTGVCVHALIVAGPQGRLQRVAWQAIHTTTPSSLLRCRGVHSE